MTYTPQIHEREQEICDLFVLYLIFFSEIKCKKVAHSTCMPPHETSQLFPIANCTTIGILPLS